MFSISKFLRPFAKKGQQIDQLQEQLREAQEQIKLLQASGDDNSDASRLENLISNLNSGILLEDENRKLLVINRKFGGYFNLDLDPKQLIGLDCSAFAVQVKDQFEDPEYFMESIDTALSKREMEIDLELRKKDGKILLRDYIPIFNKGTYKGHLWNYKDVTEERKFRHTLQQSEEKYRGIMENMDLGLMEVDNHNIIIKVYDRFAELLGYDKEELIGKNALEILISPDFIPELESRTNDRKEGKSNAYEIQLIKKNGEKIWVLVSGAPIYSSEGEVVGSIGIHYDISAQKQLMHELEKAKIEADQARMAEAQFLANMSHEIRNPINAIAGITNLMYDTPVNKEQLEYLDTLKFSSEVLMSLISDILDINKIESGAMPITESEINLPQLVRAIINTFRFNRLDKNLQIEEYLDPRITFNVFADQTMVNQILMNLIGNAIKFTSEGRVLVKVELQAESEQKYDLLISVSDTGIGIDPNEIKYIFENFKQAGPKIKEKFGGTGLGLAITKRLVEMMGGEIWVTSQAGKGSQFFIQVSLNKGSAIGQTEKKAKLLKEKIDNTIREILIVEDNVVNQNYLKGIMKKQDIAYKIANNGKEAIALTEKHTFDIILMDIRMPEMNGYDATVWIRSQTENSNHMVPIIALTASALVDERDKAIRVGMNEHLSKPFTEAKLIEVINQVSGKNLMEGPAKEDNVTIEFELSSDFDENLLSDYYQNDLQHLSVVFGHFISTIDSDLQLLQRKYEEADCKEVGKILHKIKPNFSFVGFPSLGSKASKIELQCAHIEEISEEELRINISQLLTEMAACVERVKFEQKRLELYLQK
jgi:PAS domain S-box-containing protein